MRPVLPLICALALVACEPAVSRFEDVPARNLPQFSGTELGVDLDGQCYGILQTPAIIETVTEQVIVQPAVLNSDGSVRSPAIYRTVTRQAILRERREEQFNAVCAAQLTPDFVSSVQRALAVRGLYNGPVTGVLDRQTSAAIQRYQVSTGGPDSPVLSIATAQSLGLLALPEDELRQE